MTADKVNVSSFTTRQKVTAGAFVVIAIFLLWQVKGMFGGSSEPAKPVKAVAVARPVPGAIPNAPGGRLTPGAEMTSPTANAQQSKPQQVAQVEGQPGLSQRELDLIKLQQETEAKYIAALNELQLLKINQSIAETNKAIANAKLDTVTAQKEVVSLLMAPAPSQAAYAQSIATGGPVAGGQQTNNPPAAVAMQTQTSYTVISVSQLQSKWNAVIGSQGNLYSVTLGDRLPPDDSKVVAIDKSGVMLEKDGQRKKLSLVPII